MGLSKPTRSPRSNTRGATAAALRPSVASTYSRAQAGGELRGFRNRALVRPTSTPATFFASAQRAALRSGSPSPNFRSASHAAARTASSARWSAGRSSAGTATGAYCGTTATSSTRSEPDFMAASTGGNNEGLRAAQASTRSALPGTGARVVKRGDGRTGYCAAERSQEAAPALGGGREAQDERQRSNGRRTDSRDGPRRRYALREGLVAQRGGEM